MSKKNKRPSIKEERFEDEDFYYPESKPPKSGKERMDPSWNPQNYPLQLDNPAAPVPGLIPSRSYRRGKSKEKDDGQKTKNEKEADKAAEP